MKKYLLYLGYVLRHKWYVFKECAKRGLIWRGITHDLSKFHPSEFGAYARYWYGGKKNGYEFSDAWGHHLLNNDHHWEWWTVSNLDRPLAIEMSHKARMEMLCDWIAMGRNGLSAQDYYLRNREKICLGDGTRRWVEEQLAIDCTGG